MGKKLKLVWDRRVSTFDKKEGRRKHGSFPGGMGWVVEVGSLERGGGSFHIKRTWILVVPSVVVNTVWHVLGC